MKAPLIFALQPSKQLGESIAAAMGLELSRHEERQFDDGEHKCRPLVDVRNNDVIVIHSLYMDKQQSANDKLCRLLFFIGALHDAGAATVTAVLPYLAYARKDQRTKPYDPTTTRYIARLFVAVGAYRVITLGAHNGAALQNAFQCLYDDIDAGPLFVEYFAARLTGKKLAVLAPDSGAIKNAEKFRSELEQRLGVKSTLAIISKTRSGGEVRSSDIYGNVGDHTVVIYDDMISSATTTIHAIEACERRGVEEVYIAATHGVFTEAANRLLSFTSLVEVVTTNSIDSPYLDRTRWNQRLTALNCAPLLATALQPGK